MMQAYGEGYELLAASDDDMDVPAALEVWRHGSVVRSWLLDLLAGAVAEDPQLAAAIFARFASRQDEPPATTAVAVLRECFGGHGFHQ